MERNAAEAARDEDWKEVRRLVEQGKNVNAVDRGDRRTALHYAVIWGNPKICSFLMSRGAKVNLKDKDGNQPLHAAARGENSDTRQQIRKLNEKSVWRYTQRGSLITRVDASYSLSQCGITADFDSYRPWHKATRNSSYIRTVQLLVDCGADTNALNALGQTSLHAAASGEEDSPELCSILLEYKAKIDAVDKDGNQPLHLACEQRNFLTGNLLLTHRADVNFLNKQQRSPLDLANESILISSFISDGDHALHIAVRGGAIQAVKLLVGCGADVNELNEKGQTPLHTAAGGLRHCREFCSILIEHKAKIDAVDEDGNQPLHLACKQRNFLTGNLLLTHKADVNFLNKQQRSPLDLANESVLKFSRISDGDHALHIAVRNGDIQTVKLLVGCGANVNELNEKGQTPLHTATSILVEHKAKIDALHKDGNQPLHLAYEQDHIETSLLLLSKGANANLLNGDGQTPLHTAAGGLKDCHELCSILIEHKAKIDAVDKDGNQPLHLACKQRNFLTGNLLLTHGADVNFLNKQQRSPLDLGNESVLKSSRISDGDHALHIAVRNGDIQAVKLLVGCGADVNELNEKGQTPLHTAAGGLKECRELCSILIEHKAKIDAVDKDGNQPLHLACERGRIQTSLLLLSKGANANSLNADGQTPLHAAAGGLKDFCVLCSILLKHKAKIDAVDKDGNQPLHLACKQSNFLTGNLLLTHGADVNFLNKQQRSPLDLANESILKSSFISVGDHALHIAVRNGDIQAVKLLVGCGADVNELNEKGQTPLHTAAGGLRHCRELCSILIEHKAKIDTVDKDGNQPLHLACKQSNFLTGNLLLTHEADVNFLNKQQRSPLDLGNESVLKFSRISDGDHALHIAVRNGDIQAVKLLVGCGADINELNEKGQTPLHTAAGGLKECRELCSILIAHKAKIDAVDKDGNQPLHLACERGRIQTSLLLLSKGANANSLNADGQTPLHAAAGGLKDFCELCSILLKHKAKIDAVDKDGNQPLHLACKQSNFLTGNLLLTHGADVNFLNKQQRSPLDLANESILKSSRISDGDHALHIAVRNGDIQAVKLLVGCGADVNELNEKGQTPLHTAAGGLRHCREFCSILIEHKAKIDAVDKDGNQPLHLACKQRNFLTGNLLLTHKADVNFLNKQQRSPLDLANESVLKSSRISDGDHALHIAVRNGDIQAVKLLVGCGANINELNEKGQTPLHTATSILVEHKAKIDALHKDGNQPLHLACEQDHIETSLLLLSKGANANSLNGDGQTPLHTAAGGLKDCHELCSILIEHKAKIDAVDKDGNQPLHLACKQSNFLTGNLLLIHGADVNFLNKQQRSPLDLANESILKSSPISDGNHALHVAARKGDVQAVKLLVCCGADVNELNEKGQTPLHTAAGGLKDCRELCSILIEHKAKIDAVDKDGNQPLHLACERGRIQTSLLLLSKGANANSLNADGQTPLHTAAGGLKDFCELCSILVKHKAKIDAVDKHGNQPLHLACERGRIQTSLLLLSKGANANSLNADGQTPLHTAAGALKDFPKLCSILLNRDAKIDAVDKDGNQPLHLACERVRVRTSLLLLSKGANSNSMNADGQTPLHMAAGALKDFPKLCSILLNRDAKIDAVDKDGNQPLHLACKQGHIETSLLLLSRGANSNSLNVDGQTPLHTAAGGLEDCLELCSILVEDEAKIDAVDKDGNQPLHLACESGLMETVEHLLDCNADVFATNNFHQTALHKAARSNRDCPTISVMLIAKGAHVNATDGNGDTSLQVAYQKGNRKTVEVLIENDPDCKILNVRNRDVYMVLQTDGYCV